MANTHAAARAPGRRAVSVPLAAPQPRSVVLFVGEPPLHPARPIAGSGTPPPLLAALLAAGNPAERQRVLAEAAHGLGFDKVGYGRVSMIRGEPVPTAFCVTHGDADWTQRYFGRRFHAVDPRLHAVMRSVLPCRWSLRTLSKTVPAGRRGEALAGLLEALDEAGMRSGAMFGIPGPRLEERSIFSISSSRHANEKTGDSAMPHVLMLAMCLHEFYLKHVHWPEPDCPALPLGDRQRQVLHALATGLTDREIAATLGLSMHGVDYHLRKLREHFAVRNRIELVQAAFRHRSL